MQYDDTPIERQSILTMNEEQLLALVDKMQERRMRSYSVYQEAQLLKQEAKDQKDSDRLDKVIELMEKAFKSVDTGLDKLRKYASEVQVLRITME